MQLYRQLSRWQHCEIYIFNGFQINLSRDVGERVRPRTKNVSYHVLQPEKLPVATFPESSDNATRQAVESILKEEALDIDTSTEQYVEEEIVHDDPHNRYVN